MGFLITPRQFLIAFKGLTILVVTVNVVTAVGCGVGARVVVAGIGAFVGAPDGALVGVMVGASVGAVVVTSGRVRHVPPARLCLPHLASSKFAATELNGHS